MPWLGSQLWLGLDSTCVYIYEGALLPVELSQRHPQDGGLLCLSTSFTPESGSAWIDSVQALLLYLMMYWWALDGHARLYNLH